MTRTLTPLKQKRSKALTAKGAGADFRVINPSLAIGGDSVCRYQYRFVSKC